jgi:hypothetical protein
MMLRGFEVSQGIGMAFSGQVPVETLELVVGNRREAEDINWRAKTARADQKAARDLGF